MQRSAISFFRSGTVVIQVICLVDSYITLYIVKPLELKRVDLEILIRQTMHALMPVLQP